MGFQIEDGEGGGFKAGVTKEKQLKTTAVIQSEIEHESEENALSFNWSSDIQSVDANDTVLLVKNTSDTPLHIEYVDIDNGSTESEYTVHMPTTEVTPTGGTLITGTNINNGAGTANVADAVARADETNNAQGNVIATRWLAINRGKRIYTPGVILGKNKSIAVDVVETVTETAVSIVGHYAD